MKRDRVRFVRSWLLVAALVAGPIVARAGSWEDRSTGQRVGYTTAAVVADVVPVTSAFVEPHCLPGYILCKAGFAAFSLAAAGAQLLLSGGSDMTRTKAILYRGFAGDWVVTGPQVAGDQVIRVLPDPPAPHEP
jgi:hypothetical protein